MSVWGETPGAQVCPVRGGDLTAPHVRGLGVEVVEGDLLPVDIQPACDGQRDHAPEGACRRPTRVHRDARLSWGGLPHPAADISSVRSDACHLYVTRDCVYQDQQSRVMYRQCDVGPESTFWLRTRGRLYHKVRGGSREVAGRLQKLHAPASGRLVGSERHMGRICLGLAAAQAGRVITGSGNNHEDGTGWNSR